MHTYSKNWLSNDAQDQHCEFRGSVAHDKCHTAEAETYWEWGWKIKQWYNRRQWVEHLFLLSTQYALLVLLTSTQNAQWVHLLGENQDPLAYKTKILWNPVSAQLPCLIKTLYQFLLSTKDKMRWWPYYFYKFLYPHDFPLALSLNHRGEKKKSVLRFSSCCYLYIVCSFLRVLPLHPSHL